MSYCRYCGTEIMYVRTANEKWMPYDVTGEAHFCDRTGSKNKHGLEVCRTCGKPVFSMKRKCMDYTTLELHTCKKGDITRYEKYQSNQKQQAASNDANKKRK